MKAAFFTAADPEIGLGHLFRCDALAQALTLNGLTTELLVDSESGFDWVAQKPLNTSWQICRWKQDPVLFSSRLNDCNIPIFDAYDIDASIWKVVREAERQCVVFDDFGEKPVLPGILINGSPGAGYLVYRHSPDRSLLLGYEYQVLREPFWLPPPNRRISNVQRAGILMGGTDPLRYGEQVIRIAEGLLPQTVEIIEVGKTRSAGSGRVVGTGMLSAAGIRKLFLSLDFLICGGGQSVPEAVSCGLPALIFCLVENQRWNYMGWVETGAVIPAGDLTRENRSLFEDFSAILSRMMERGTRENCSRKAKDLNLHSSTLRVAGQILSFQEKK
jgi:spore coat polysaccharide biosynthesis predicted glycosyltransferase SpsG